MKQGGHLYRLVEGKEGDQEWAVHVAVFEVGIDEGAHRVLLWIDIHVMKDSIHRVLLWIAVKDGMHRGLLCDERLKNGIVGL